jgi:hypothetical protein
MLTDYYSDSLQAWFRNIAAHRVTWTTKKFHCTMSNLSAFLMYTIGNLCDNPTAGPYGELQRILLLSYGLSATQKTARQVDRPPGRTTLGSNKPSTLMDQLTALKLGSLDDVIKVLFFQKMPGYIRDVANPKDYKEMYELNCITRYGE